MWTVKNPIWAKNLLAIAAFPMWFFYTIRSFSRDTFTIQLYSRDLFSHDSSIFTYNSFTWFIYLKTIVFHNSFMCIPRFFYYLTLLHDSLWFIFTCNYITWFIHFCDHFTSFGCFLIRFFHVSRLHMILFLRVIHFHGSTWFLYLTCERFMCWIKESCGSVKMNQP